MVLVQERKVDVSYVTGISRMSENREHRRPGKVLTRLLYPGGESVTLVITRVVRVLHWPP